ncbi:hypothetical protein [Micromonospora thermarum]|uniref:LPXTG-motif cell wall anchor domain-containing protein n=1 Tax=Micromonospora thermarum TaxID=2720024 RepID=A0ABX0ZD65_9ACTN|nr:hypothetical protein [Micromonospora thermarum]NJP35169.1 hypothetical protein [Micromonospora thermarum]
MRLSRIIMALTVGLAVAAMPTAAGAAQPQPTQPPVYPPGGVELSVGDPQIVLGETITLFGRGWNPGERIVIRVSSSPLANAMSAVRGSTGDRVAMTPVAYRPSRHEPDIGPFSARADGTFEVTYTPRHTGHYLFEAVGESGRTATARVTVLGKKKHRLPVTGASTSTPMKVGGGLVGAGAVLLLMTFAWRQRHRFNTRSLR